MFRKILWTDNDYILTLVRLVLGVVYFAHGAQKALGWFGGPGFTATMNSFAQMNIPAPLALLAMAAELLGGLGLIVGLLARVAALGIITNMVVAFLLVHAKVGFFMNWTGSQKGEGFEFHLLAIALGVIVLAKGAGALSIDRALASGKR
jgi:putative oxidoreductase